MRIRACVSTQVPATRLALPKIRFSGYNLTVAKAFSEMMQLAKHAQLVTRAVEWLRHEYGCGIILAEQYCVTGEVPDVIGWKGKCKSVLVECKVSRSDFLADTRKPFRLKPEQALGSQRFYLASEGLIAPGELPESWGLLECKGRKLQIRVKPARKDLRTQAGLMKEMNLLLASLRRVELRIEPQTITEFLKWKNRMAEYNGGRLPEGLVAPADETNCHLSTARAGATSTG